MNVSPKISVVIPVYNVEKYLPDCLDSLIAQKDFENWEAICIDDGSADGSGKILDEYAARDSRFRIVHQKNGGVSLARNKGISMATAPYLMFIDSDDWIEPNMFRTLYDTIEQDQSDMVVCAYFYDTIQGKSIVHPPLNKYHRWDKVSFENQPVTEKLIRFISPYLVNKIFRRDIFVQNNLKLEIGVAFSEDRPLLFQYLFHSEYVSVINKPLYHYRQQGESVTCQLIRKHLPVEYYETIITTSLRVVSSIPDSFSKKKKKLFLSSLFSILVTQIHWVNDIPQICDHPQYARIKNTEWKTFLSLFRMSPKIPSLSYLFIDYSVRLLKRMKHFIKF